MKRRLVLAAALAVSALPLPADAQSWLADRRFSEGIGIRVGNLELHPGIGAEFGYDSNYFQRAESENPVPVLRLRITPSLSLGTLGPQRGMGNTALSPLTFRLSAYAAYNELFAARSQDSDEVSRQRHVAFGASFNSQIMPGRRFGGDIYADFQREAEPSNSPEEEFAFNRGSVRAGTGVTWAPGGGLFEWRLGYEILYNYFEQEAFQDFNNAQHGVLTRGRWRFLPKTALLFDSSYRFIRYTHDGVAVPADGDVVGARVGLNGLLTPRLSLLGLVGWTASFYEGIRQNSDTIIGQVEAKYFVMSLPGSDFNSVPMGLSTIALGYTRAMQNAYLSSYYTRDRGYANVTYFLGGVFVASLEAGFSHLRFPPSEELQSLEQDRIDARLFAEYRFTDTVGLNSSVMFTENMSEDMRPRAANVGVEDLDYTRWQAFIGLRWFM